jgi:hypothetical protein
MAVGATQSVETRHPRVSGLLTLAGVAVWLVYAGIYVLAFAFYDPSLGNAFRGGLANAIPDGVLAIAALAVSRRIDRGPRVPGLAVREYARFAAFLVPAAAGSKVALLWLEAIFIRRAAFDISPGAVIWHFFLSGLTYVSVTAVSHAWLLAQRLREEEANAARADALRAQAEMAALRAQLNPHFLFNTLHSVIGMVRRDPTLAEGALEKLGDLLHYAIRVHRDGVDWTTLRREWEFVQTYLDLESIRLADRLRVDRRLDDAALDVTVPTFSLQPLVENAVRHGVAPRAAGGRIAIDAHLDDGKLRIDVQNEIGSRPAAPEDVGGGLGLRLLRGRLQALYGGAATMTAGPMPDGNYHASLALPLMNGDNEAVE